MVTYNLTSAQDNVTGEYRQVGYMRMEDEATRLSHFSFLMFIAAMAAFTFIILARNLGELPASFRIGILEIVVGVGVFVATVVIHEGMHGLVLRRYGVRPKFGWFRSRAIATITVPGHGFRRNTVILVALTPLVVLTCLALLGIWLVQGTSWVALFALMAVVNVGISTGDLWVIGILLHYPSSAWTVNDQDGMRILMPME